MLPNLKDIALAFGAGVVIGGLVAGTASGFLVANHKNAQLEIKLGKQKLEAAQVLAKAVEANLAKYQTELARANTLELENKNAQARVSKTLEENRRLVRLSGGLRDPGARDSCVAPATVESVASGVVAVTPAKPGKLSDQATEFLLQLTADADRLAEYAETCYKWVNR